MPASAFGSGAGMFRQVHPRAARAAGHRYTPSGGRSRSALGLLVIAAIAGGCTTSTFDPAPPRDPVVKVVDLRNYRIDLQVGERVEVRLPGNPSTGHRWTLVDPLPPLVRPIGVARLEPMRTDLAGAPGHEVWTFEAVDYGTGTLSFAYRRPSDPDSAPSAQRTQYRVEVR
jgi:inhibitor of cysteine peptidase